MRVENQSIGRIPIIRVTPQVDGGKFLAKAFRGEVIPVTATAFREGHDLISVDLLLTDPLGETQRIAMREAGSGQDLWVTDVQLELEGIWRYRISAWDDAYATWAHNTEVKLEAGIDQELVMLEGIALLQKISEQFQAKSTAANKKLRAQLDAAISMLSDSALAPKQRYLGVVAAGLEQLAKAHPIRGLETLSEELGILCERELAGAGSWYEFFPRSEGAKKNRDGSWVSGNFKTATARLAAVAKMGFNVLYLPPIHPIGQAHKKGPNNTLNASASDPGSPWAIGSSFGGHDTVHPDLGTDKDFANFVKAASKLGISVAMDLALQASPDHPWVKSNPEWFTTRADGTIAYAENPPKKYQDIFPINFDNDPEGIYAEVVRVLEKWIKLGVKIFRVDNPHTKPVAFWQRLIAEINAADPDVIFLAEAFTRPPMMHTLGKAGFQQSYTYFTWRNSKEELASYFTELAGQSADFFRPNLWVNTPDILTEYLQFGGKQAFKIRATLAATAGASWGMYAGFELYEAVARPGSEENIDNEKYEYKQRDWKLAESTGVSLAPRIELLNQIRATNPALRQLRNLRIHKSDDPSVLVYSKSLSANFAKTKIDNSILVVINLDPHSVRETMVHLDLEELGMGAAKSITVKDLITGEVYTWGANNYVRLDSFTEPAHIFQVTA